MVFTHSNQYGAPEVCFLIFQIIPQVQSKVLVQHIRSSEFVEHNSRVQVYHVSLGVHHHEKASHHRDHKVGFTKGPCSVHSQYHQITTRCLLFILVLQRIISELVDTLL